MKKKFESFKQLAEIITPSPEPSKDMPEGFTKGEWKVMLARNADFSITIESNGQSIAEVYYLEDAHNEREANARLIAAAPAMYEELKEILKWTKVKNGRAEWVSSEEKVNELKAILNNIK